MPPELSFLSTRKFVPQMAVETTEFLRIGEERLSERMWKAALPVAEQALQTCHIQGIKYGDLDPNKYGNYTVQDAIYCYKSKEQYKELAQTATDEEIKKFAEAQYQSYEEYTTQLFKSWCIKEPNGIDLAPKLQDYIQYKSEILEKYHPLYFIVSNIPCLRLWYWLATELRSPKEGPANLYSFWVKENLQYQSYINLQDFIDSKTSQLDANKAIDVYKRCMQGEFEFFALAGEVRNYLQEGDFLLPGDKLFSQNKNYYLIYQDDGNLVVYETSTGKPVWNSDTKGKKAWRTYMQDDGNLVVYENHAQPVWSSGVAGSEYKGSQLVLENYGKLIIYLVTDKEKKIIWHSS